MPHSHLVIETWRLKYNEEQPKKSLCGMTPSAYARQLAKKRLSYLLTLKPSATETGGTSPGVIPISQDKFMVTRQAATSLSGIGNLTAEVMQEAISFCGAIDKDMSQLTFDQTKLQNIICNYTQVELQFSCVVKPDLVGRSGRTAGRRIKRHFLCIDKKVAFSQICS